MPRSRLRAALANPILLLAMAPLFWAGNHIVGRAVAGHVAPGGLSVLRWVVAAAVLAPFVGQCLRRDWATIHANAWTLILLALAGGGLFGTLQFFGLQYTTALNVAVLNSTVPAFIVLAGALIFRDPVRLVQVLGVGVSLVGVLVIISKGDAAALGALEFNGGDILVIANMALFAIYSACLRLRPIGLHWMSFTLVLCIVSGLANVPLALWEAANGQHLRADWLTLLAVLYVGIFASTIAYGAWSRGIELIGAARAGVFLHLVPVYGAVLSMIFLGESLRLFHIIGLMLILAGVALAARKPN